MKDVSARSEPSLLSPSLATPARSGTRIGQFLEENGTVVMVVGAFAVVLVATLRTGLAVDGWMALLVGRSIAAHGLPSHDTLTIWAHGRRWVDQQWLSQLALYGLWRLGGLKLALLVHAALTVGALGGAAALSRRLGGSARSTTWICIPVLVAYYPGAAVMRPQSFAYPLFVIVMWLLAEDARRPSRRVFATLPLLVLWANLHGSALLGAGLVALAGVIGLAGELRSNRRVSRRALALIVLPWLCLLASPYALELPGYYRKVILGSGFSRFVTEWAPTTLGPATIPLYLLVIGGMWLLGRAGRRLTSFEKLAFLGTAVLAFQAVRNITWFGLLALAVLPVLVDELRAPAVEPRRLNRMLSTVVVAGVVVAIAGVATNAQSWFLTGFPPAAAAATAAAAGPHGTVLATSSYADWLLWTHPQLDGRVAYDARFELLTQGQLRQAAEFEARVEGWKDTARRYTVLVIDKHDDSKLRTALVQAGVARVIRVDRSIVVLRVTPRAAAQRP